MRVTVNLNTSRCVRQHTYTHIEYTKGYDDNDQLTQWGFCNMALSLRQYVRSFVVLIQCDKANFHWKIHQALLNMSRA